MWETEETGSIPGSGRSLEEGIATHSSLLAWRLPWMEEPAGSRPQGHEEAGTTEVTQHARIQ